MGTPNKEEIGGKSVTEQLEGRCVIRRVANSHEADEHRQPVRGRAGQMSSSLYVCFFCCWIQALSAHLDHCLVCDVGWGRGSVVLVEMDVARTKPPGV